MGETKKIQCCDCQDFFDFTPGEQEFYRRKGFNDPKRCKACRMDRKDRRDGGEVREFE